MTDQQEFEILKLVLDKFLWAGVFLIAFGLYLIVGSNKGIYFILGGSALLLFIVIALKLTYHVKK